MWSVDQGICRASERGDGERGVPTLSFFVFLLMINHGGRRRGKSINHMTVKGAHHGEDRGLITVVGHGCLPQKTKKDRRG